MKKYIGRLTALILTFSIAGAHAVVNGVIENSQEHPEVALLLLAAENIEAKTLTKREINKYGVCSGTFISDQVVLTAGHCLTNDDQPLIPHLARPTKDGFEIVKPVSVATDYIYEDLAAPSDISVCSPGPKPLITTRTPDIGLILFPKKSSSSWARLSLDYVPRINEPLHYLGYGTEHSPFDGSGFALVKSPLLRSGSAEVWRANSQRIGFVAEIMSAFAADGDSGAPVFVGHNLVAVMSTISERCETEFGEDYAILNTATLISTAPAQNFLKKALSEFAKIQK